MPLFHSGNAVHRCTQFFILNIPFYVIHSDFEFFIRAIPYNFYALTTLLMILVIIFFKTDFGAMKKSEALAKTTGRLWNEEAYGVISGDVPTV